MVKLQELKSYFLHNKHTFSSLVIIASVGFLSYSNSLQGEFVFDDFTNIVNKQVVRDLFDIKNIFLSQPSRFISNLTFALNYHFFNLDVFGYHLTNIIIHTLASFFVFWFLSLIQPSRSISLIASLFFVSHPIQTQAVSYMTQRVTSLSGMFYIFSLALYAKSALLRLKQKGNRYITHKAWFYFLASLTTAFIAFLTKENSYTLPISVVMVELFFFSQSIKKSLKQVKYFIPFFFIALFSYITTLYISYPNISLSKLGKVTSASQDVNITRQEYLLTQLNVVRTYIRLSFFPINQRVDYDYPVSKSIFEYSTFFSFVFLLFLMLMAIYFYKKSQFYEGSFCLFPRLRSFFYSIPNRLNREIAFSIIYKLISFGILFFFLALLIESSIVPIADVINEHRLYLPSVGFTTFLASVLVGFSLRIKKQYRNYFLYFVTGIIVILFSFATFKRNVVWSREYLLWKDSAVKSPYKVRPHYNLATVLVKKGDLEGAILEYKRTIKLNPKYIQAYNNLAAVYTEQGRIEDAKEVLNLALEIDPKSKIVLNNIGVQYFIMGKKDIAKEKFNEVLKIDPWDGNALNKLGEIYLFEGKIDEAVSYFERAVAKKPGIADAYYNLGSLYGKQGNIEKAIWQYKQAINIDSRHGASYLDLGILYFEKGMVKEATDYYNLAVKYSPDNAEIYYNLGLAYQKQEKFKQAVNSYVRAVELNPSHLRSYNNLGVVYMQLGMEEKAKDAFEAALNIDPQHKSARNNLEKLNLSK